jgi:hypothetical protein
VSTNIEVVTNSGTSSATALCPTGKVALGGGIQITGNGNPHGTESAPTDASGNVITSGTPHGWFVASDSNTATLTAFVICSK